METKRIVLLGPPGSGKGTQAKLIEKVCSAPHISTGDMLREAAAKETELGIRAKSFMEAGKLVPDDLMVSIVEDRLQWPDSQGKFILDGYPRTVEQAGELDRFLQEHEFPLDVVLSIEVDSTAVIERLSNRRVCRGCGRVFNRITDPPREKNRCDDCSGDLYQRDDDTAQTIARRLEVYQDQTAPVKAYYSQRGILLSIDGSGKVDEVYAEIVSHLKCAVE